MANSNWTVLLQSLQITLDEKDSSKKQSIWISPNDHLANSGLHCLQARDISTTHI